MPTNNANIAFKHYSRSGFDALGTKDDNTFYVVTETDGRRSMYLGATVLSANRVLDTPVSLGSWTSSGVKTVSGMSTYSMFRVDFYAEWGDGDSSGSYIMNIGGKADFPIYDSSNMNECHTNVTLTSTGVTIGYQVMPWSMVTDAVVNYVELFGIQLK